MANFYEAKIWENLIEEKEFFKSLIFLLINNGKLNSQKIPKAFQNASLYFVKIFCTNS